MNRNDNIGLNSCKEAQESIENERGRQHLTGQNWPFTVADMKYLAEEARIVANGWSVQLDSFTERKTAIFFKHIDDLDAVCGWRLGCLLYSCADRILCTGR